MKFINYFKKEEWRLIFLVGGGYFINLYLLRGQNAMGTDIFKPIWGAYWDKNLQDWYLISNALGLLIGTYFFGFLGDKKSRTNVFFGSIFLHLVACIFTLIVVFSILRVTQAMPIDEKERKEILEQISNLLCIWRLITGVIFAGGFGIGITLIVETLDRSKRLWGSVSITAFGMLGICAYVLVARHYKHLALGKENTIITMGIGIALSLALLFFQWRYQPILSKVAKIDKKANIGLNINKFWINFFSSQTQWKNLLLLGLACLPVQFCINFLVPKLEEIDINEAYLWYYLAFLGSILITACFYNKIQRSLVIIRFGLIWNALAMILSTSAPIPSWAKCVFMGLGGGGVWWLVAYISVLRCSHAHRASAGVFVSNFSRAAIVFLFVGNSIEGNYTFGILTVTLIAVLATFGLQETFSPRLKENTDEETLNNETANLIEQPREDLNKGEITIKDFLGKCAEAIKIPVCNAFNTIYFAFFCVEDRKENKPNITRGEFVTDDELFPNNSQISEKEKVEAIRGMAKKIMDRGECFSFASEILHKNLRAQPRQNDEILHEEYSKRPIRGIALYHTYTHARFLHPSLRLKKVAFPKGYRTFDLSVIELKPDQEEAFWKTKASTEDIYDIIEFLDSMSELVPEEEIKKMLSRSIDPKEMVIIKRALLLHKLDALRYQQTGYYAYYIPPYYKEQNGMAFLISSFPASIDNLRRLTVAVTTVMSEIFALKAKTIAREEIINQNNHGMNTILSSIKTNLKRLEYAKNQEESKQYIKSIDFNFNFIYQTTLLSNALAKVDYKKVNKEAFIDTQDVSERLATFEFSLSEAIIDRLRAIQEAIETVAPKKNKEEQEFCCFYIEKTLIPSIQKYFSGRKINGVKVAFQIILQDLLTNAVRYNAAEPEIQIDLKEAERSELPDEFCGDFPDFPVHDYLALSVSNKFKLSQDNYSALLGKQVENSTASTTRSFGIDTIRRILRYDGLGGASAMNWYFVPKKKLNFDETSTTIFLLIPIKDTNYEQSERF